MADDKLPDTLAETLDKEAEEKLADKNTPLEDKPTLIGNILTTTDARHEADLESEQLRQNAQRQATRDIEAARLEAAEDDSDYKDIRSPKPKA